jgi:alcohol dehydrogenase class IV
MSIIELARTPRITAGVGARGRIAALVGAGPVLLVADPGLKSTGRIEEVAGALRKQGVRLSIFDAFQSDPTVAQTDAAAAIARGDGAQAVVCLGGGSALDLGKAVAAIAPAHESAVYYQLGAHPLPTKGLRKICMPTTSGTGSETTRTAIVTRDDHAKVWLWGDEIKADEVVLDPELTVSLPAAMTAATGVDALVHAVEAATNRNANPAAGLYAHEAIRLVARHLVAAVENPRNLEARAALQWAAAFAGIAIDNSGTAIAHALGHAMGSLRPIHHGRAVGIAMLASLPWNVENNDAFAACAVDMGGEPSARGFIAAYEKLLRASGMKLSVREEFAGVTAHELAEQTARPENAAMRDTNARQASEDDLLKLAGEVLSIS